MKLTFLGTCAGTEPMPSRQHTSFLIEAEERIYWFDAGEGCSRTATLAGYDLLNVNKIIISHPHIDHIGGLPNLLFTISKLNKRQKKPITFGDVDLFLPDANILNGVQIISNGYMPPVHAEVIRDGELFNDGILSVTAYHNHHLQSMDNTDPWRSFTFRIEHAGKSIVYSGDVRYYSDMDGALQDSCDMLIVETGHISIDGVYEYTKDKNIGKIYFNHCGREFLHFPTESAEKVNSLFDDRAVICEDKMTVCM